MAETREEWVLVEKAESRTLSGHAMLETPASRSGGDNRYAVGCPSLELSWEKSRLENTDVEVICTLLSKSWELDELT